jgi:hypothetical protein
MDSALAAEVDHHTTSPPSHWRLCDIVHQWKPSANLLEAVIGLGVSQYPVGRVSEGARAYVTLGPGERPW